jgi:hypothetical protein
MAKASIKVKQEHSRQDAIRQLQYLIESAQYAIAHLEAGDAPLFGGIEDPARKAVDQLKRHEVLSEVARDCEVA